MDQFIAKAQSNNFTLERISSLQMLVPSVRRLWHDDDGIPDISIAGALAHLGWPQDWKINTGPGRMVEKLSVTSAIAGVAETGSVILRSDELRPTTQN
ncbi:MAG TPA: hypothetical protein EYP98_06260, partial [Planctomycetes bacterium]|nr:hypothetical protein [Planctomycetota bacterium]